MPSFSTTLVLIAVSVNYYCSLASSFLIPCTSSKCRSPFGVQFSSWSFVGDSHTTYPHQLRAVSSDNVPDMSNVGFVLLAGGTGSRMKANMPKQFLILRGKPVLHHSIDLFLEQLPAFLQSHGKGCPSKLILVMDPMYQPEYQHFINTYKGKMEFANPGKERQGSVENGLNALVSSSSDAEYVAVHDSARPLVSIKEVCDVIRDAKEVGAAVLGVPCKATIKESDDGVFVKRTIPRSRLWEVHTPQVIRIDTLYFGFREVEKNNWEVTDDVSIVELLGEPVKLTKGEYTNLKITTPEDMDVAEAILEDRHGKKLHEVAV